MKEVKKTDFMNGRFSTLGRSRLFIGVIVLTFASCGNAADGQPRGMQQGDAAMEQFSRTMPDPISGECRFVRGKTGRWIQDMEYAEKAQYREPLRHYSGNAERFFRRKRDMGLYGDLRFRPSTTYRWEETEHFNCQPTILTLDRMCKTLRALKMRRIFILGDSLNLQLAQSMWMWLTTEGSSPTPRDTLEPNFESYPRCSDGYEFKIQFIRNDELLENDQAVSIDHDLSNCGTYCYPWTKNYTSDFHRTLLVVNAGAHIHEYERFQQAFDRFLHVFDSFDRPSDVVLFRTLVPGHWDCSRPGLEPFKSVEEYLEDVEFHQNPKEEVYSWSKFSKYNEYAVNALRQRTNSDQARIEVVDVYPSTILRPDGHCSDEFRPPAYIDTDCLHYTLPGPIDWWSHLIFSHLLDIALSEGHRLDLADPS